MTKIEIVDMREFPRMIRPGFTETMLRITYRTEKGYTGVIDLPKAIATPERIKEELEKAVTPAAELVGETLEV